MSATSTILIGDCLDVLATLPEASVQCCVTSPPYWGLRDYGVEGQIGLEATPDAFVAKLVAVFAAARRVLREDGTLWLNMGDSYVGSFGAQGRQGESVAMAKRSVIGARQIEGAPTASVSRVVPGLKPKDLVGIPWLVAFALRADGWFLRSEIIWSKRNPMPESVTDRPTKAHETVFLLSKSAAYFYDADAIREPHRDLAGPPSRFGANGQANASLKQDGAGLARSRMVSKVAPSDGYNPLGRNARSVWEIASQPFPEAHFATFPEALPRRCILAGSKPGDMVLDPFGGSGTTGKVAVALGRNATLIELNPVYAEMAGRRTAQTGLGL